MTPIMNQLKMINFRVVAFDPGGTTGWATYSAERIQIGIDDYEYFEEQWNCGQLGPGKHHRELFNFMELEQVETTHYVTESFEYRNAARSGLVLVSCEYIGVMELFTQGRGLHLTQQTAAKGKGFVKNDNLRKLDLWVTGGADEWRHSMDAYRHLLQFMMNNNIQKDKLLRKGWK